MNNISIPQRFQFPSPSFQPFWENGRGKKMLSKLPILPSEKEIAALIPLYFEVDELANKVIQETVVPLGFEAAMKLFSQAFTTNFPIDQYPNSAQLIAEMETTPEWLDRTLLEFGSLLCQRSGSLGLMVLRNYCLMGGYESAA
ncbi:MAG: hypothetical protein IT221_04950, partial [Fluviicola sp.]|nr:hypothetical protein [Fluviicola sp.]